MAGLIQRPNGIFYGQFDAPNRTRKRVSLKTKRKDTARRLFVKLTRDHESGAYDPWADDPFTYDRKTEAKPATVTEALTAFLARKRRDGKKQNTLNSYEWIVGLFAERIGDKPLTEVTGEDIDGFCKDTSVSKASRRTRFTHVRAFIRWTVKNGLLTTCPLVGIDAPPKADKTPKAI
ncbi:MAG TPA: hypothetical protein VFG50_08195, partial [Rhodothermales bacterium]|nr:hypothetical protein [Rhodothermales bacterium]